MKTLTLKEAEDLTRWCQDNNLLLNVMKTQELIVDFGMKQGQNYTPLNTKGSSVERVDSFKNPGVHTEGLAWDLHTDSAVREAGERLFHLRCFWIPPQILTNFYSIENVLTENNAAWYRNSTEQDLRALQKLGPLALLCIKDFYTRRCKTEARRIIKDPSHPDNGLFSLLWSTRRYQIQQQAHPPRYIV